MSTSFPKVKILMGSDSDWPVMKNAKEQLAEFGIQADAEVASAHRSPARVLAICESLESEGYGAVICGAGCAAHLAGVVAAHTTLPVIGVPLNASLNGLDALLSTVQMPPGVPVASMAIGEGGAKNAGLFAVEVFAVHHKELREKLKSFRKEMAKKVEEKSRKIRE